ncbi:MAG: AmmeMemoRadiSam system protein B, partial [Planctomycetota bacterium]|nr:AmmeMemoRadiSam system protein B [Planctomycetota bacterium]
FTAPAVQTILPLMNGEHDLDTIVTKVGRGLTREMLEDLVAQLDDACLILGPKFDSLLMRMRAQFDSSTTLPPASTAQFADLLVVQEVGKEATEEQKSEMGPEKMRKQFDAWIDQALKDAPDPSFDALPKAIVAPHIDYFRGWLNYAQVYGRMRVVDRPARALILGTNHFGFSTGVCGCDKGFETPLGASPVAGDLMHRLDESLTEAERESLYAHRFDHEREHSIELQVAWLQHIFGQYGDGQGIPVYAALIHDPCRNNGESYDGAGLGLPRFVEAMQSALEGLEGSTLIISSADLSHVGPQFGDPKPLAGEEPETVQMREKVLNHDREMLNLFMTGKAEELVTSMAWQQNPTRWCSVGNMVAARMLAGSGPEDMRLLNYAAAMDQQGLTFVSSCAAAIF